MRRRPTASMRCSRTPGTCRCGCACGSTSSSTPTATRATGPGAEPASGLAQAFLHVALPFLARLAGLLEVSAAGLHLVLLRALRVGFLLQAVLHERLALAAGLARGLELGAARGHLA